MDKLQNMNIIDYGAAASTRDFPNPDHVRPMLSVGQFAVIRDTSTNQQYMMTQQSNCWKMMVDPSSVKGTSIEKIYRVEFMDYTNIHRDTVCNQHRDIGDRKYIVVGSEPFLVRESELEFYRAWGNGFRSIEFVGNIFL